jgi:hypothetical protein
MWRTRIRNGMFVAVGAAALAAAIKVQIAPARAGVVIDDGPLGAAAPPSTSTDRKKGKPAPEPTPPTKGDKPKLTQTLALAAAPLLTVPDFKGKRLSVAMREARKLGLAVRGAEDGEWIPAIDASAYRVRRQSTKPGTEVEPGTVIRVGVREIASLGQGY